MNLRDKLRAVSGPAVNRPHEQEPESRDCRHLTVSRPMEVFPPPPWLTRPLEITELLCWVEPMTA